MYWKNKVSIPNRGQMWGARTTDAQKGNSLHCTARPKIQSQSQIFKYGRSIFCLPHWPNYSDIFDLCLHWVSVVHGEGYQNSKYHKLCFLENCVTSIQIIIWVHKSMNIGQTQGRTKSRSCRLTTKNSDYQIGWAILTAIFILPSENSPNLTCYLTLRVHNINDTSIVPPLGSSLLLQYRCTCSNTLPPHIR